MGTEHSTDFDFTIEVNGEQLTAAELASMIERHRGSDLLDAMPIQLPGRAAALAWLAVALAASNDKDRPALYRRMLLDIHPHGVALASTDGYWLARAFVPYDGDHDEWPAPSLDEVPASRLVVADVEFRVRDLMRYVERITRPKAGEDDTFRSPVAVTFTRTTDYDIDQPTLDPTLSTPQVLVELPGEERIVARQSEVDYPSLAQLMRFEATEAEHLLFNPSLIGDAARACTRIGAIGMRLRPTTGGAVQFVAEGTNRHLHGVLMPMFDRENQP